MEREIEESQNVTNPRYPDFRQFSVVTGRNLTEVLVEEFRLNDRFSGLSMDRIWGGFMDEIKEEGEDGKVPEPEPPETKARRALNEKTKKRRRRRARNQMAPSAVKTTRANQKDKNLENIGNKNFPKTGKMSLHSKSRSGTVTLRLMTILRGFDSHQIQLFINFQNPI